MNYFIQNLANGEIKIGYSNDAGRRRFELEWEIERQMVERQGCKIKGQIYDAAPLQLANPITPYPETWLTSSWHFLVILASVAGDKNQEKSLHKLFGEHRLHGEWFAPVILKSAIHWVFDWCMNNCDTQNPSRKAAYDCLWNWIVEGIRGKKLQGEIVWCGRRYTNGCLYEDISGARLAVTQDALDQFAESLKIKTEAECLPANQAGKRREFLF